MLHPVTINGDVWRVARVAAGDPHLIDRTNTARLATTDKDTMTIYILDSLQPPKLDKVLVHEIAHAITISYGLLDSLRSFLPPYLWVDVEEWAAQLVENHALEAAHAASSSLGRAVCIGGMCDND